MDNFKETENITLADIAASYQKAIVDILIIKIKKSNKKDQGANMCYRRRCCSE